VPKYSMTCTCGHEVSADAATRGEAVAKVKAMWTQEAVDAHVKEKHPGETMSVDNAHREIDTKLAEVPA